MENIINFTDARDTYKDVKIKGEGTVNGHIACEKFYCMGSANVYGNIQTNKIKVHGEGFINGSIKTNNMRVVGKIKINEDALFNILKLNGEAYVKGSISGKEIICNGE